MIREVLWFGTGVAVRSFSVVGTDIAEQTILALAAISAFDSIVLEIGNTTTGNTGADIGSAVGIVFALEPNRELTAALKINTLVADAIIVRLATISVDLFGLTKVGIVGIAILKQTSIAEA